ncbi:MAG TPA: SpoIIE family protein phosphatase [Pyrinomonadaceae bacterium]|nr:SpoIIE family protein phosphatase [Chloracidobacterium sp.]MBP9936624.1 SpoIIE family protein phosphatase [Pyrinomonadaceae bacterium]MBK7802698.1 SpoIIE family protein phosphatase [Chloracidobacterium sp.]MBK9437553.1 SpoIIE family protein phosphatase [Chloracidobacterium sp.]MBL0240219.1 SpoIIE family protein phosphatase [Chloracidobacterium sp.]
MSDKPFQDPAVSSNLSTVEKLRLLLDITKTISRSLDLDEVLNLVMDTLGSLIPYDAAGIYLIEFSEDEKDPYVFKSKAIRGYQISFNLIEPRLKMGEGFLGTVAQSGKSIISHDVSQDPRYFPARELTRSEMLAPIISNDRVIGVFDLESDKLDAYDDDDLALLHLLTSQVAIIIEKVRLLEQVVEKKRIEAQLEIARQVQLELLPEADPAIDNFDISAYVFPTEEVSGDYYDWVKVFDDQIGIVVADAVGKGIPAALLMSFLRASLRSCVQIGYAPHIAFSKVSNLLRGSIKDNQFITAIYGMLDSTNRTFVFSNAGHNPPLLIKPDGEYRFVEYGDLPLGMFEDLHFHQHFIRFEENQVLVIYTDGITEAANPNGEEYGQDRFAKRVLDGIHLPAKKMIDHVRKGVADFTERKFLDDDGTLFIVKAL